MKDLFDQAFYQRSAAQLAALHPRFEPRRFLSHALADLASRELMDRLRRTAEAFHLSLPLPFEEQTEILRAHAPQIGHNFIGIWPCHHVATHGLAQPALSLATLRELTRHGSAEFAIRPFLVRDLPGTLSVMHEWAASPDEHVRRLASEGARPRLPWGLRLRALIDDPGPALPILERLRADPSLYVRKSVANHLNDITKDHPDRVLGLISRWDRGDPRSAWIIRHGLRTLVKRGEPRALAHLGAGATPELHATLSASPRRIHLGDTVTLHAELACAAPTGPASSPAQTLVVDYVVDYARPSDRSSSKVFKWSTLELARGASLTLTKRQTIRDFSTRRHHPGPHRVQLQVNGHRLAETSFTLLA
jgi:3-methyladenine DNA glycosylase AlkC